MKPVPNSDVYHANIGVGFVVGPGRLFLSYASSKAPSGQIAVVFC